MADLHGKVALVTGASRGVGKGIALGLGEAGATVYVTARSAVEGSDPRGTLARTVAEIAARGGKGIALACDHADDAQVRAAFERVRAEHGRLDVLVNNAMSTPQRDQMPAGKRTFWQLHPAWEVPLELWDAFLDVGLRSHYVASALAGPLLIAAGRGLIVHVSSPGAVRYAGSVAYGVGKAGVEKLSADLAVEFQPHGVASVTLWPGFIRTEDVLAQRDAFPDLSKTSSPLYVGRAVAALAGDANVLSKTGQRLEIAALASEYGFTDPEPAPPAPGGPP